MARAAKLNVAQRRSVASLAKKHGASRTTEILSATKGDDVDLRPQILSDPVSLTVSTVCRYAKENGVELSRGRRKQTA